MAGRIGGDLEKRATAAAKARDQRIAAITETNMAAKKAGTEIAKGQLELNQKTQADNLTQKGLDRQHDTAMQNARFGQQSSLQLGQQKFIGGENALDRTAKASEGLAQRTFIGGENALDRAQKTDENSMNRQHDLIKQGRDITGKAFLGGLSGDKTQQMESSARFGGDMNYAGLEIPKKPDDSKPWQQVQSIDEDGNRTTTGSFNQHTGERKVFLGGMDPNAPSADQKSYLAELKMSDPVEYERIKQLYRVGSM